MAMERDTNGFVYFVQARGGGPIKIGWALDAKRRLLELQVGSPMKLNLLGKFRGTPDDERALHVELNEDNKHGEWFWPSESVLKAIEGRLGRLPKTLKPSRKTYYIADFSEGDGHCSFCGRDKETTETLLQGAYSTICADCIIRAHHWLAGDRERRWWPTVAQLSFRSFQRWRLLEIEKPELDEIEEQARERVTKSGVVRRRTPAHKREDAIQNEMVKIVQERRDVQVHRTRRGKAQIKTANQRRQSYRGPVRQCRNCGEDVPGPMVTHWEKCKLGET